MGLLERFYPHETADSAYGIPYGEWYDKGYRGVIFDIDNTLVPHGADGTKESIRLYRNLRQIGFKTMLLSNNKEERVKRFCKKFPSPYIYKAGKPRKKSYIKAMEQMGTDGAHTLFVGDQLFTDIWGARGVGMHTILVDPIHPKEEIQIVIKRVFEKIVLFFYRRSKRNDH